jgi:16S rRNA processing protein RimM
VSAIEVVVGRIGRAHGVKGELSVEVRTDEPERRFAVGAVLATQTPDGGAPVGAGRPTSLTVAASRWHQARLLLTFAEIPDRTAAEAVRGLLLVASVPAAETPEDPEEYYDHQLIGLTVVTDDGRRVGELAEIVHSTAQDLLVIRAGDGAEVLVPFVEALVPDIDLAAGRVTVADRPGLLTPAIDDDNGGA